MKSHFCVALVAVFLTCEAHFVRRQGNHPYIAFSAGLTHNVDIVTNTTILYDKEWIDTDNAYDPTTGMFIAPIHGLYTFIYHGLSETDGQLWLDLYKNTAYLITAYAHAVNDYAAASNSITIELDKGDQVYVKGHGNNTLYGQPDEIYSSFSGFINVPLHGNSGGI